MLLDELVRTSRAVAEAGSRLTKISLLGDLLRRLAPDEIEIAIGMLSGEPRQGRIGIGYATLWAAKDAPAGEAQVPGGQRFAPPPLTFCLRSAIAHFNSMALA